MLTPEQIKRVQEREKTYGLQSTPCPSGKTPEGRSQNPILKRMQDRERFRRDGDDEPVGQGGTGVDESW